MSFNKLLPFLALLCLTGCASKYVPSVLKPLAAPIVGKQVAKDEKILGATNRIEAVVEGNEAKAEVVAETQNIKAAIAEAPGKEVQALVATYDLTIQSLEKRLKDAEDSELKAQARWLRWFGLGAVGFALLLFYLKQPGLGGAAFLGGLVALGLAQLVSQPWFMPAVTVGVGAVVVAICIGAYQAYRKNFLADLAKQEAEEVKDTLGKVVPVLDRTYDNAKGAAKDVFEKEIFPALSRAMDASQKRMVHKVRIYGGDTR